MARKGASAIRPDRELDPLAEAVERLTAELSVLRQVIDEIREDFSWLVRNGLPVQPIEHVHVKRMALDPCAEDWGERLEIERSTYLPRASASPLESNILDDVVDDLKTTFEAAAQGQLEVVLTALDGVRAEILSALRRHRREPAEDSSSARSSTSSSPSASSGSSSSPSSSTSDPISKPPPGQLF
jgi:hypothetical protein